MRFYIIAGEASGDLHASNLVKAMKQIQPGTEFRGFGGDLMRNAGVQLVKHYRETAFMGFTEVVMNLRKIFGFINLCKEDILNWKPDAIILIDYPGFNLRIASWGKQKGFRIFYYISPQVWAWKSSRVRQIRQNVDRLFVILPFEKEFYKKWNYDVEFVGHPLLDAIADFSASAFKTQNEKPVVALLPGSRKQEIKKILPVMLEVIPLFTQYQFITAGVSSVGKTFYDELISGKSTQLVFDETYALLSSSKAAIVASGTATLETALFNVPEIVCYKGSAVSIWIGRRLVSVPFISLVNLICEKEVVKELIQNDFNPKNLQAELSSLLNDENCRQQIFAGYTLLREKLGNAGASKKVAEKILASFS